MSVGTGLAQARHDAGYTLDQVSEATRVRKGLLEALERDDFDACGGDVYARGHLKSYCQFIGVDPAPFLAEFDADRGASPVAVPTMTEAFEPERRGVAEPERRGPNWSAAMAVALAAVLVLGVWSVVTRGSGGSSAPQTVAGTSAPSKPVTSAPATTRPSVKPSPTVIAQRPTSGVSVVLRVTGKSSWVSASNGKNGTVFYEGILRRGDTRTWTDDKRVRLVVGNAGGVTLTVNGRDLGSPGGDGQVAKVQFGPGDPTTSQG